MGRPMAIDSVMVNSAAGRWMGKKQCARDSSKWMTVAYDITLFHWKLIQVYLSGRRGFKTVSGRRQSETSMPVSGWLLMGRTSHF